MKKVFNTYLILIQLFIISSCDFTPRIYKDILAAQEALEKGNYQDAIKKYEIIIEKSPSKIIATRIYYQLGKIYSVNLGNYKAAIKNFRNVEKNTEDPLWLVKTKEKEGEVNYLYLKNFKASVKNYKQLCSFVPKLKKYDFYQYRLSKSYLNLENLNKSLKIYEEIQKKSNHKYLNQSFFDVGLIYYKKKEWAKAIVYWQEYIKKEKRKDEITKTKFLMANAYETMENLKRSYDLYYSILNDYPNVRVIQDKLKSIFNRKVARKR